MRRADRLFQLILILQDGKVRTARYIAEKLEVSERTIYRDIADLVGSGIPIDGEAGVGYLLRDEYQLPPLMFTPDELKALALGASMVTAWSDKALGSVTKTAMRKIESILPTKLKKEIELQEIVVPNLLFKEEAAKNLGLVRQAIKENVKIRCSYNSLKDEVTERTIWPFLLFFWGNKWTLGAWCEKRQAFRSFRIDLMSAVDLLDPPFEVDEMRSLKAYVNQQAWGAD
ncbi:MAG: putative DNA-binding transcriptional regulator YafY [Candidatus Azotimanducaceae bacterium]|jgi:predicted DNA-binding transcriptional regulator YafY